MAIIIATIAFILCWIWIEITLIINNKYNFDKSNNKSISYSKFIWFLRLFTILLFVLLIIYMYIFENVNFQKTIQYCLGIIK